MAWTLTSGGATIPLLVQHDEPLQIRPKVTVQNPVGSSASTNSWVSTPSAHRRLSGMLSLTSDGAIVPQTSGPLYAGTISQLKSHVGQISSWSSPNNAKVEDGAVAFCDLTTAANIAGGEGASPYLIASNFGFAVPTNNVIIGIKPEAKILDAKGRTFEMATYLVTSGNPVGVNLANPITDDNPIIGVYGLQWPFQSLAYRTWGGGTNTGGLPLTPSIVNATTFGFCLNGVAPSHGIAIFPGYQQVDAMRITVYHGQHGVDVTYYADSLRFIAKTFQLVTITNDKGAALDYYIQRLRIGRVQNIATLRYQSFEMDLIRNG